MVRFSKSRRSRASRSSRSNLSYLLVGTVGALSGSLVFALATIAFLLATQPLPPKDNRASDGIQTLRAEEQAEVDFRQIVARSAELQLSPDVHRASRVSAYRMLTADGSIHTMRHNNRSCMRRCCRVEVEVLSRFKTSRKRLFRDGAKLLGGEAGSVLMTVKSSPRWDVSS